MAGNRDTIGARGWGLVLSAQGVGALIASVVLVRLLMMRRPMGAALSLMAKDKLYGGSGRDQVRQ